MARPGKAHLEDPWGRRLSKKDADRRDALAGTLLSSFRGGMEILSSNLGLQLGYYQSLHTAGPATARQLARRTGTNERYTREWLEQQAIAGVLVPSGAQDAARRTYSLPPGHAHVLLNEDSPAYLGFAPQMASAMGLQVPALVRAYRAGHGVSWSDYGPWMSEAQGRQNRGFLRGTFAPAVLPAIPDVHRRLRSKRPARVADLACGVGWASIAIAETYPNVLVDGLDLDAAAIRAGRRVVKMRGLEERVRLHAQDAGTPGLQGRYDLVVMVEALHDLSRPVPVLRAARRLLAPGGTMIVVDENVAEKFVAPGPELERVFYGFSVLACLPNGLADRPSAATGTVIRPSTVKKYATAAGFSSCTNLDIPHDFFRFYRLDP